MIKAISKGITIVFMIIFIIASVIGIIYVLSKVPGIDLEVSASDYTEGANNNLNASAGVQAFLQSAQKIKQYMYNNGFRYPTDSNGRENANLGNYSQTYDGGSKDVCCATYVSWCLQDAGFIDNSMHTNSVSGIKSILSKDSRWQKVDISNEADLVAGDICFYSYSHTDIYGGNSKFWNVGGNNCLTTGGPTARDDLATYVYRLKE